MALFRGPGQRFEPELSVPIVFKQRVIDAVGTWERCCSESAVGWNLSSSTWHVQRTLVPLSRRLKLQYCFVASLDENFANYPEVTICSEKNSLKVFPWREKEEEEEVENQKTFFPRSPEAVGSKFRP